MDAREAGTMIERFEINERGRDYIVGDIHGCFTRLQARLDALGFDSERDRLFSVGDLVDRGPESDLAMDWVAKSWFHAVRGNHEDMAIRWPAGNMDAANYARNGGGWNLTNPPELQKEISHTFGALPVAIELQTRNGLIGIVHAECPFHSWPDFTVSLVDPNISNNMRRAIYEAALWSRERVTAMEANAVAGVRAVVVGHTPMDRMTSLGNTLYIDTGAVFRGRDFTIIDAETLQPV